MLFFWVKKYHVKTSLAKNVDKTRASRSTLSVVMLKRAVQTRLDPARLHPVCLDTVRLDLKSV